MLFALSRWLRQKTNGKSFMFAIAMFCLSNVGLMLLHQKLQQVAATNKPALDLRQEGYSVEDVSSLLSEYGPEGRQLYIYFEALDLAVFMWSYAAVLSMMLSLGTSISPFEFLKLANLIPWAAAMADSLENITILAMLLRYPDLTTDLAPYAVAASRLKWQLLFASASAVGGVGLYCLGAAARRVSQGGRSRDRLEAEPGRQQRVGKKQR